MYKHTLPPRELDLKKSLHAERHQLQTVEVPIVTVSATYKAEIADLYGEKVQKPDEVVFSRAHFSMAIAVLIEAYRLGKTFWLSDPTNFVSEKDWARVVFTEGIGKQMARHGILKALKDAIDAKVRSKLPITGAITSPLLYLTGKTRRPIISLHYEAGNILAKEGKRVVQVVTDPHVRPQYLDALPCENLKFCVFDENTKLDFLKVAGQLGKNVSPDQIVITGPPVDPRIVEARGIKEEWDGQRPVRIAISTGGLGTNKTEIESLLGKLVEPIKNKKLPPIQLILYAGTHEDFREMYFEFAKKTGLEISNIENGGADLRVIYSESIVDANELLISYLFPWADCIITKPSGDMAYEGAASGASLLFLKPWGPWEENIRERFLKLNIGRNFVVSNPVNELAKLFQNGKGGKNWFESAQEQAFRLPRLFLDGPKRIIEAADEF